MFTKEKIAQWFKILIFSGLLILVTIIFSQKTEFTAVDLGRHLENGKIIWSDSQVLFKNFYSYTEPNTTFINHHWFTGVIYYAVYSLGGFSLLSVLNILLILATFILAFTLARKKAAFYLPALLSIPIIFLLSERVDIRPEIFSYFFIILTWFILDKVDEKKNYRLLYWLVPLFALWVNIHIYFFLGLALVGFKTAAKFLPIFWQTAGGAKARFKESWSKSRVWVINLGCLFLACLFNPNFIRGLLYPLNVFRDYGYEVAENKSVFYLEHFMINNNIPLFKVLLFLLIVSFAARFFFSRKAELFELFTGIFLSVFALFAIRNLSIFALAALILISANLAYPLNFLKNNVSLLRREIRDKYRLYLAGIILFLILLGIFYLIVDAGRNNYFMRNSLGWGISQGSEDSIKFFRDNKLSGPIFNNYDLGSALTFWLYPAERVFVDNRPEAYSSSFFSDIYRPMQLDKNKWKEYDQNYQFKTIYFSHTDATPWAQAFFSQTLDEDWGLVYFDRYVVIFLNNKRNDSELVKKLVLDEQAIRARLYSLAADSDLRGKFHLAYFATLTGRTDIAEEIYRGIIFDNPDNSLALESLGFIYADSFDRTRLQRAIYYFKRALEEGCNLPGVYNSMGIANWRLGYYPEAEANWHSVLKLEKMNPYALYNLKLLE